MPQTIAVLDFGSQYTQIIARRIRECQVFSKIYHFSTPPETLKADGVIGIILSGGPSSVFAPQGADARTPGSSSSACPVLGHLLRPPADGPPARRQGGQGRRAASTATGRSDVRQPGRLFAKLPKKLRVWNSHGDKLVEAAAGLPRDRQDRELPLRRHRGPEAGLLRHPVPSRGLPHRARASDILRNFLVGVCGARQDWTTKDFIKHSVDEIRATVGQVAGHPRPLRAAWIPRSRPR